MDDVLGTTPRRVLQEAYVRGVHSDCLASGWENACPECVDTVESIYRDFYQARDAAELIQKVHAELMEDRKNRG